VATLLPIANNPFGWLMGPLGTTSLSLRAWLRGGWAILFSHPDDFVNYDLEMDRWLVITQRAFAERRIQPIALASPALDPEHNWVTQVSGDCREVLLEDPVQQHSGPVDLQIPVLREALERPGHRFAMIIDNTLRIQKMFTYSAPSNLPSPLELLGWADALRARQTAVIPRIERHCPSTGRSRMIRATRKVPVRDLIGTRCKTAAAPATVTGE
jgi:alkyl hydroperoxide reductase subunit AhpC